MVNYRMTLGVAAIAVLVSGPAFASGSDHKWQF